jgi:hypothetical protein
MAALKQKIQISTQANWKVLVEINRWNSWNHFGIYFSA